MQISIVFGIVNSNVFDIQIGFRTGMYWVKNNFASLLLSARVLNLMSKEGCHHPGHWT